MKNIVIGLAVLSASWTPAESSTPLPRSLKQDVGNAEAIVIGKLAAVSTRAYSFGFHNFGENNYTDYYDDGAVTIESVLKGPKSLFSEKVVHIMFPSRSQGKDNPYGYEVIDIGAEGVWMLRRDWHTGIFYLSGAKRPFPKSIIGRVQSILGKR